MAVCHAFGQGGDARWPFARHPASEMAVCQAPGQRDGRLPGIRPALRAAAHPTLAKFREGNLAKVGWRTWPKSGGPWAAALLNDNKKILQPTGLTSSQAGHLTQMVKFIGSDILKNGRKHAKLNSPKNKLTVVRITKSAPKK